MANAELDELLSTLEELDRERTFNKLASFKAYKKQNEFFALGAAYRERMLLAGNQLGKTEAGAVEAAYHLTGKYPDDWKGRRWDRPVRAWAAGESSTVVRDVQQKKLCGQPGVLDAFGTGYIPLDDFADKPSLARGVTDAYDTIQVKHYRKERGEWVQDGVSTLTFKSYEQGRTKFQGDTIDFAWLDEEAPPEIYSECLTRITATDGMLYTTFTPLKGRTDVVNRFLSEADESRAHVTMTIYDAAHIKDPAKVIAGYPSHEREARAMGVPMMGEGRIFPISDEAIVEEPLVYIPPHWVKLWGIDFGIGHPFGAALILWDRDNDVIHLHATVRVRDQLPLQHAAAMKPIGAAVPVAWPKDGGDREASTGKALIESYKATGLKCLGKHATWEDGSVSTEQGILEMHTRMTTGRFRVARHLLQGDWGDEFRNYHRKDGQIVKVNDDLMSATRIAIMAKRYAALVPLGGRVAPRETNGQADGLDFDIFG